MALQRIPRGYDPVTLVNKLLTTETGKKTLWEMGWEEVVYRSDQLEWIEKNHPFWLAKKSRRGFLYIARRCGGRIWLRNQKLTVPTS